jgi:ketosteroid isomerase-like protein
MNRRIVVLAAAFVFVMAGLCIAAAAQGTEDEIKKLETDRAAAVIKGDMAMVEKQTSDDYTLINPNGQMSDKAQMLDAFKSGKSKISMNEISDMKVRIYGNTAIVTGKSNVKGVMGGKDVNGPVMFTRVYVKKGGHWQSVALQQTRVSE